MPEAGIGAGNMAGAAGGILMTDFATAIDVIGAAGAAGTGTMTGAGIYMGCGGGDGGTV